MSAVWMPNAVKAFEDIVYASMLPINQNKRFSREHSHGAWFTSASGRFPRFFRSGGITEIHGQRYSGGVPRRIQRESTFQRWTLSLVQYW